MRDIIAFIVIKMSESKYYLFTAALVYLIALFSAVLTSIFIA